jgi:hypothetical protein
MSINCSQTEESINGKQGGAFKHKRKEYCGYMGILQHRLGYVLPATEKSIKEASPGCSTKKGRDRGTGMSSKFERCCYIT